MTPAGAITRATKTVFVAYPYNLFDKRDYRRVYTDIGREFGVHFVFADERITNMQVLQKIRLYIEVADFSLFDISGWNPNVALELGVAYALDKGNWYICFNPEKNNTNEVPSNIRGLDRIQYRSFAELGEKLTALLAQKYPPEAGSPLDEFTAEIGNRVTDLLRNSPGLGVAEIAKKLKIQKEMVKVAVRQLTKAGKLVQTGQTSAARYSIQYSATARS